jgi:hypothetical protein
MAIWHVQELQVCVMLDVGGDTFILLSLCLWYNSCVIVGT